jgi:CBS domain-containing protein
LVDKVYRTLPVTDEENRIVGILTDGDLLNRANLLAPSVQRKLTDSELRQHLSELRRKDVSVDQVMTAPVVTVSEAANVADAVRRMAKLDLKRHPDTSLLTALNLLLEHHVKRLPVVDEAGRLVGLLGRGGVLQILGRELNP